MRLERWLGLGRHGEMDYMAKHRELRARPEALVPGTVSVISARMPYWPLATESAQVLGDKEAAYVARYALGRDYHRKVRQQLQRLATRIGTELAAAQPGEEPARIAHDCLSCCLGSIVADLPTPVGLPERARFALWLRPAAPETVLRLTPAGGPPPQRAPPGFV